MIDDLNEFYLVNAMKVIYDEGDAFHMTNDMYFTLLELTAEKKLKYFLFIIF